MSFDYSLYVVTDTGLLRGRPLLECVSAAVAGGATVIQLREKNRDSRALYEQARELKSLLDREHVPLIVNDRIDIALAVGAAGVHLGQNDLPCQEARRLMGKEALIGVSVGSALEVRDAEAQGADYLGAGPVFTTATKSDAGPAMGVQRARELCEVTRLPVVAIGGISSANVAQLKGLGLAGVAVVSAIMAAEDPEHEARRIKRRFLDEGE